MVRYIADNDDNALTLQEPPPSAYLSLLVNGRISQSFPLRGDVNIGRDKSNTVVVSDQKVSRHHASLTPVDDAYIVADKGSANGTYLNGVLIGQPIRLKDKDRLNVGDTSFLFSTSEPAEDDIEPQIFSPAQPVSVPANKISLTPASLDGQSIWAVVGCLGLVIISLLIILAILIGLFLGRSQLSGPPESIELGQRWLMLALIYI